MYQNKFIHFILPFLFLTLTTSCTDAPKLDLSDGWQIAYTDNSNFKNPEFDDSKWQTVTLPLQTVNNVQVVWIRKKFTLPDPLLSSPLSLFSGKIIDADTVYLNGVEIGRTGSAPPEYIPMWNFNRYYFIPPGILFKKRENTIAIRAFASIDPKFADRLFISTTPAVHWHTTLQNIMVRYLPMALGIMIFLLGIFTTLLFFYNRKEKQNLMLGAISILWGILSIHFYNHNYGQWYNLKEKVFYTALAVEIGLIYFYLEQILKTRNRVLETIVITITLLTGAICFYYPANGFMGSEAYFRIGIMGIFEQILWGYLILRSIKDKKNHSRIIAVGYTLFIAGVIHDALAIAGFYIITAYWISLSYPILLFSFGITFLRNFSIMQNDLAHMKEISEKNRLIHDQKMELESRNYFLENDLKLAKVIQKKIMPGKMPGENIFALYKPMEAIGGDYYDFVSFRDKNRIGILISDVSGHGVAAALITAILKGHIERSGELKDKPSELFCFLNESLRELTGKHFITIFYGIYDFNTRSLEYSNAGHHPPIIISNNSIHILGGSKSAPITAFRNDELAERNKLFQNNQIILEKGSKLFLYTDGLVETEKEGHPGLIFGEAQFHDTLLQFNREKPEILVQNLYRKLIDFRGSNKFDDDVCMICMDI